MIQTGQLRHKICVEEKIVIRNSYGEEEITWSPFLYAWASIGPLTGREYFAAQQTQASTSHKIMMRYQAGIHSYHRIQWNERIFNIDAILNEDEKNLMLTIFATEAV